MRGAEKLLGARCMHQSAFNCHLLVASTIDSTVLHCIHQSQGIDSKESSAFYLQQNMEKARDGLCINQLS